ncbi:MAG: YdeI/OmpD-associated family protein [Bacteroidia bacterium]
MKNIQIDYYIEKSADFAKPILERIRYLVHKACPDVMETIKWGMPTFEYKGLLCSIAAFKAHCSLTFHKGNLMKDEHGILSKVGKTGMGQLGKITSVKDLPSEKIFISYVKQAVKLNEAGVKQTTSSTKSTSIEVPDYFLKALKKNNEALKTFETLSNSHKKEYIDWITEAKKEETRISRIEKAIAMLSEGKSRNHAYQKK